MSVSFVFLLKTVSAGALKIGMTKVALFFFSKLRHKIRFCPIILPSKEATQNPNTLLHLKRLLIRCLTKVKTPIHLGGLNR